MCSAVAGALSDRANPGGHRHLGTWLGEGGEDVHSEAQPSKRPGACVLQEFADSVSQLVTQKFCELTAGLTSVHARHKALAGIVMTKGKRPLFFLWESRPQGEGFTVRLILGAKGFSLPDKDMKRRTHQEQRSETEVEAQQRADSEESQLHTASLHFHRKGDIGSGPSPSD